MAPALSHFSCGRMVNGETEPHHSRLPPKKKPPVHGAGGFYLKDRHRSCGGPARATLFAVGYRTNPESFSPHSGFSFHGVAGNVPNRIKFILILFGELSIEKKNGGQWKFGLPGLTWGGFRSTKSEVNAIILFCRRK